MCENEDQKGEKAVIGGVSREEPAKKKRPEPSNLMEHTIMNTSDIKGLQDDMSNVFSRLAMLEQQVGCV